MSGETTQTRLKDLAESVQRLKEATSAAVRASGPGGLVSPDSSPHDRVHLMQRAARAAASFAGFRPSTHLPQRLVELCRNRDTASLAAWVNSLEVERNPADLAALVEDLVNHETHFLRDEGQLRALQKEILPQLIARKKTQGRRQLLVWSAGCATGEEVYTLIMLILEAMVEAGVAEEASAGTINLAAGWQLKVVGTDISRRAIAVAREAVYNTLPPGSFRGFPEHYLRFFDHVGSAPLAHGITVEHRRVKPALSRYAEFRVFNLMSSGDVVRDADVVCCRNVLIYLEAEARAHAQGTFREALAPGGCLVLSAVDTLVAASLRIRRCGAHVFYEREHDREDGKR